MKHYIKLSFAFLLVALAACSPDQGDEGYLNNRVPAAFFPTEQATFFISPLLSENVYDVNFGLTMPQDEDLEYVIEVDPASTAVEGVDYTTDLQTPGIFPADKLMTSFKITAITENAISEGKTLIFNIVSVENAEVRRLGRQTLVLKRSCPFEDPADFTGSYLLTQTTAGYPVAGGASTFGDNVVVQLQPVPGDTSGVQRQFTATYYPDLALGNGPVIIKFTMDCNNTVMNEVQAGSGVACSGSAIVVGPTTDAPSTYDNLDDSEFEITFFENANGACNDPGQQTTIRFTKQ